MDGRGPDAIRPIDIQLDYLPGAHGSALFTRGETQVLTTITVGSKLDEQLIDGVTRNGYSKLMFHYNFPGFSVGEVKPNRGPARREIGHGNLVMRALKHVIQDQSPIRAEGNTLSSNGSSSMAFTCGASLACMDASINITSQVAGIAMGIVMDPATGQRVVLTDILGEEDHIGDMDFKVTGTKDGITACQMDIKVKGIDMQVIKEAIKKATTGIGSILEIMNLAIAAPRANPKPHIPSVSTINIPNDMIGTVIGPSGKTIQGIQKDTGATLNISEEGSHGLVTIHALGQEAMDAARKQVQYIVEGPTVGDTYQGKVTGIKPFGAFVAFAEGIEPGLLHKSEISDAYVEDVSNVLKVGQAIQVKLIRMQHKKRLYSLSAKGIEQDS